MKSIRACYVYHDNGNYYYQLPADNQWGFELIGDDGSTYPGGLDLGSGRWHVVPDRTVPVAIRQQFATYIDGLEVHP